MNHAITATLELENFPKATGSRSYHGGPCCRRWAVGTGINSDPQASKSTLFFVGGWEVEKENSEQSLLLHQFKSIDGKVSEILRQENLSWQVRKEQEMRS